MAHHQGGGYGQPQWQAPRPKNKRAAKICLGIIGGCAALAVVVGLTSGGGQPQTASAAPTETASSGATHATKAKRKADVVTFIVTGQAPAGVDVTYGTDTDNRQGPKRLSVRRTLKFDKKALYYVVTAQLQGSGDINCKVMHNGKTVASGHASGTYNICSAQWNGGLLGF